MNDKKDRGHEDLLPGESHRSIKKPSEKKSDQPATAKPVQSLRLEDVSMTGWLRGFLNRTEPAMLLVWSALALIAAALFSFIGLRAAVSPIINESFQGGTSYGGGVLAAGIFALPAFLLGIIGTLLPMWAVGRLIADAVREGAKK